MRLLFVSDVHLAPARPDIAARFLAFLEGPARGADALYILGDLFEYWLGDDDLDTPFNREICAALRALRESGTALFFLPGNRDFLAGDAFARASGTMLLADPSLIDAGAPLLLAHGDALCTDDDAYQKFRAEVRGDAWRAAFLARPLAERRALVENLRAMSVREKSVKSPGIMDVNEGAVAALLRAHPDTILIHGHTHRPGRHAHDVDGIARERWVLSDWECDAEGGEESQRGDWLEWDGAALRRVAAP